MAQRACPRCDGKGECMAECGSCAGLGESKCSWSMIDNSWWWSLEYYCDGGQQFEKFTKNSRDPTSDTRKGACPSCNGRGWLTCGSCKGNKSAWGTCPRCSGRRVIDDAAEAAPARSQPSGASRGCLLFLAIIAGLIVAAIVANSP